MNRLRSDRAERTRATWQNFYDQTIAQRLARHRVESVEGHVLEHLRSVASDVPAYTRFLTQHGVDSKAIRSLADFATLPITTKDNYQRAFPLPDLCRGGALDACDMLAVSSGSTGTPAFWPRVVADEVGSAMRFEQVLHDSFRCDERRTLAVICFALGNWVGGMYTTACCRHLATKGYPLTVATPGNQKPEILRVLQSLRSHFDQVVLFGYPPFLKDVIDSARADGFDWHTCPTRLVMAGEVFSEEWRSLVCERLGVHDTAHATASLYGTADGGVLANESALSVTIRRFLALHPAAARELFGEARLPTLCQYDPLHRFFELDGNELVFSGDGALPLVRYKILDRGGLVPFDRMRTFLADHGFDMTSAAPTDRVRELPFVFVFGRANFALSFYGANIYPENVSVGLEQPALASAVTGKFVMQIVHDSDLNAALDIAVELAPGKSPSEQLASDAARSIQRHLERLNSEFAHYVPAERRLPRIQLLPHADPAYFPLGVKHRYTRS
jgi:phenylacetate-CoA ligase